MKFGFENLVKHLVKTTAVLFSANRVQKLFPLAILEGEFPSSDFLQHIILKLGDLGSNNLNPTQYPEK